MNTLSPGPIETPIFGKLGIPAGYLKDLAENFAHATLLKRMGRSEEVAKLARFLLSEESSFITGEDIVVDGGVCHT